jgi:cobalamin biosynthesis Mg chelatase CobN
VEDSSGNYATEVIRTVNVVEDPENPTEERPRRGGSSKKKVTPTATTTATTTTVVTTPISFATTQTTTRTPSFTPSRTILASATIATTSTEVVAEATTTPEVVVANAGQENNLSGQAAAVGTLFGGGIMNMIMWILGILFLLLIAYFVYRSFRKSN